MIVDAHEWLDEQKTLKRVSYKKLGLPIGYSDSGMINAFRKKTLSLIQINKIGVDLEFDFSKVSFIRGLEGGDNNHIPGNKDDTSSQLTDSEKINYIFNSIKKLECDVTSIKGLLALSEEIRDKDK